MLSCEGGTALLTGRMFQLSCVFQIAPFTVLMTYMFAPSGPSLRSPSRILLFSQKKPQAQIH